MKDINFEKFWRFLENFSDAYILYEYGHKVERQP